MSTYEEVFAHEAVPGALGDTTLSELRTIAEWLQIPPGGLLIDLGCGPGGPGLWLARHWKAVLLGVDLDEVSLGEARRRAAGYPATYLRADLHASGLEGGRADGLICLDVMHLSPDVSEAMRLLKPGARMAVTFVAREHEANRLPGALLEQPTQGWKERRRKLVPDQDLTGLERRLVVLRRPGECRDRGL